MVSAMRKHNWILVAAMLVTATLGAAANGPKFYRDDPIVTMVDSQDASGVQEREIDVIYDTLENSFAARGDITPNVRAQNLNTIDEVPDSSWFTNRIGSRRVTVDELLQGPDTTDGPAPGPWTVVAAKSDGVTPGFTVRDSKNQVWFVKFDPPGYPAMATGTEVVVTKLFWALGYYVPEVHIAMMRPHELMIDGAAQIRLPSGKHRPLKRADIFSVLQQAHRESDGSYRVIASKRLDGRPVGGFRFYGIRSDDPNDFVAHEHRRELRAYGTFAAWLNHVDSKSINTLDTVIDHDGKKVVRHHLLDFGSTMGSAGVYPREAYEGWEHLVEPGQTLAGIPTFGLYIKNWRTVRMHRAPSVGAFPLDSAWDPEAWKPRYPNAAFRAARLDDKFWAARRLHAFTDEMLNAVIKVGRFNDAHSEEMLSRFLNERRDAIVGRYLPALNPIVDIRFSDGRLTFKNAAVDAGVAPAPREYVVRWRQFDNDSSEAADLVTTRGADTTIAAPVDLPSTPGTYLRAEIAASGGPETWAQPAHAYFRRDQSEWTLVGFERMPDGNTPGTKNGIKRAR